MTVEIMTKPPTIILDKVENILPSPLIHVPAPFHGYIGLLSIKDMPSFNVLTSRMITQAFTPAQNDERSRLKDSLKAFLSSPPQPENMDTPTDVIHEETLNNGTLNIEERTSGLKIMNPFDIHDCHNMPHG